MISRFAAIGFVLALVAVSPAVSAPTQSPFPAPTGPYAVGRTEFDWVDPSRPALNDPSRHRELAVWVWYPASPTPGAEPALWMPGQWGEEYWARQRDRDPKLPAANPIVAIRTHAYEDAPLSSRVKTYPVLMFEPGLGPISPLAYATFVEDMASRGFVVVGVNPTDYSQFTILSGGRVVTPQRPEAELAAMKDLHLSRTKTPEAPNAVQEPGGPVLYTSADPKRAQEVMAKNAKETSDEFSRWIGDMRFALDRATKLNADPTSPFAGRLDLDRVGAFGHSRGGSVSLQVAKEDSRVRAAIDLDGANSLVNVFDTGVSKPVLIFQHRTPGVPQDTGGDALFDTVFRRGNPGYLLPLNRSVHMNFSDLILLSPELGRPPSKPDAIDPARALVVVRAYVGAFFGKYLKGEPSPLLNGPAPDYPEVRFETNK